MIHWYGWPPGMTLDWEMRVGLMLNIPRVMESSKLTIANGIIYSDRYTQIPLRAFLEVANSEEEAKVIAADVNSARAMNAAMRRKSME